MSKSARKATANPAAVPAPDNCNALGLLIEQLRLHEDSFAREQQYANDIATNGYPRSADETRARAERLRWPAWKAFVSGGDRIEEVCNAFFGGEPTYANALQIRGRLVAGGHTLAEANAMTPGDAADTYVSLVSGTAEPPEIGYHTLAAPTIPDCSHGIGFRSVNWYGTEYSFTANQAACVKLLWEAWQNRTPDVGGDALLEAADVTRNVRRVDLVFRDNPAWGTMIVSGKTKGSYRLQENPRPAAKNKTSSAKPARKKKTSRGAKRRT